MYLLVHCTGYKLVDNLEDYTCEHSTGGIIVHSILTALLSVILDMFICFADANSCSWLP